MNDVRINWGSEVAAPDKATNIEREVKMAARGKYAWQILDKGKLSTLLHSRTTLFLMLDWTSLRLELGQAASIIVE